MVDNVGDASGEAGLIYMGFFKVRGPVIAEWLIGIKVRECMGMHGRSLFRRKGGGSSQFLAWKRRSYVPFDELLDLFPEIEK